MYLSNTVYTVKRPNNAALQNHLSQPRVLPCQEDHIYSEGDKLPPLQLQVPSLPASPTELMAYMTTQPTNPSPTTEVHH